MTPENSSTEPWLGTHGFGAEAQEGQHGDRASGHVKQEFIEIIERREGEGKGLAKVNLLDRTQPYIITLSSPLSQFLVFCTALLVRLSTTGHIVLEEILRHVDVPETVHDLSVHRKLIFVSTKMLLSLVTACERRRGKSSFCHHLLTMQVIRDGILECISRLHDEWKIRETLHVWSECSFGIAEAFVLADYHFPNRHLENAFQEPCLGRVYCIPENIAIVLSYILESLTPAATARGHLGFKQTRMVVIRCRDQIDLYLGTQQRARVTSIKKSLR